MSQIELHPTYELTAALVDMSPLEVLNWAVAQTLHLPNQSSLQLEDGKPVTAHNGNRFNPTHDWSALGLAIECNVIVLSNHFDPSEDIDGLPPSEQLKHLIDPESYWGGAHCYTNGTTTDTWDGIKVAACRSLTKFHIIHNGPVLVPIKLLECWSTNE